MCDLVLALQMRSEYLPTYLFIVIKPGTDLETKKISNSLLFLFSNGPSVGVCVTGLGSYKSRKYLKTSEFYVSLNILGISSKCYKESLIYFTRTIQLIQATRYHLAFIQNWIGVLHFCSHSLVIGRFFIIVINSHIIRYYNRRHVKIRV